MDNSGMDVEKTAEIQRQATELFSSLEQRMRGRDPAEAALVVGSAVGGWLALQTDEMLRAARAAYVHAFVQTMSDVLNKTEVTLADGRN